MVNNQQIIASSFNDTSHHKVLTNSWRVIDEEEQSSENLEDNVEGNVDNLSEEQEQDSNSPEISEEWKVTKITRWKMKNNTREYKTLWSTNEVTWEPFSCFVDVGRINQAFLQKAKSDDWEAGLATFSQKKLIALCKAEGKSNSL